MNRNSEQQPQTVKSASPTAVHLLQLTDCHIFASPQDRLLGRDTRLSFSAVCEAVTANSEAIDLLLATGDLSQDGSAASYAYLAERIDAIGVPSFWIPGNHDHIETLRERFRGDNIHAAKLILLDAWLIVMLDSTVVGQVHGKLSAAQLDFMTSALRQYPEHYALICLHHQAVDTGSAWLDQKGLQDNHQLRASLRQFDKVKGVLWGHVHQAAQSSSDGIEWMSTPSTCVQFKPDSEDFAIGGEAPGYRLLTLHQNGRIESRVERVELSNADIDYSGKGY